MSDSQFYDPFRTPKFQRPLAADSDALTPGARALVNRTLAAESATERRDPLDDRIREINERRTNVRYMREQQRGTMESFLSRDGVDLFETDPITAKPIEQIDPATGLKGYVPRLGAEVEALRAKVGEQTGLIAGALSLSRQRGDPTPDALAARQRLAEIEPIYRLKQEKFSRIKAEQDRLDQWEAHFEAQLGDLGRAREMRYRPAPILPIESAPARVSNPPAMQPTSAEPPPAGSAAQAVTPAQMVRLHAQLKKAEAAGDPESVESLMREIETGMGQLDQERRERVMKQTNDPTFWSEFGKNAKDAAMSFGVGANSLIKLAGDLYGLTTGDMDNAVSRYGQEAMDFYERRKSSELRAAEQARRAKIDAESDELGKAWAYVRETVASPALMAGLVAENVPNAVAAGGAGALVRKGAEKLLLRTAASQAAKQLAARQAAATGVAAAVGTGAVMQGADVGSGQYAELVTSLADMPAAQAAQIPEIAELIERGATLDEAKLALALTQARTTGALAGALSIGAQMLPGARTIERAVVGGVTKKSASRIAGAAVGAAGEAASEVVEEGGGRMIGNVGARPVDPERSVTQGVGETVAQAGLAAGALGAGAGSMNITREVGRDAGGSMVGIEPRPSPAEADQNQNIDDLAEPSVPAASVFEFTNSAGETRRVPAVSLREAVSLLSDDFGALTEARELVTGSDVAPANETQHSPTREPTDLPAPVGTSSVVAVEAPPAGNMPAGIAGAGDPGKAQREPGGDRTGVPSAVGSVGKMGEGAGVAATSTVDARAVLHPDADESSGRTGGRKADRVGPVGGASPAGGLAGEKINREWTAFSPESKTLGIPRAEMPQVKAEHRGALTQFLKARDIMSEETEVLPTELKPTQAEYSPAKVQKAREFTGGDRAILVSSDNHVVDGHHQFMAKLTDAPDEFMRVIKLDAPIRDVLEQMKEFPSVETAGGSTPASSPEIPDNSQIPPVASKAPTIARGQNKPEKFIQAVAKAGGLKSKDKATRFLQDFAPRLHKANAKAFESMEVHVLKQAEWDANERTGAQTPDSSAAYDPGANTLYLNADKMRGNDGVDAISAIVHESGHFASRFALGEPLTQREWEKLTHDQRVSAKRAYDPAATKDADPVALLKDARAREEWVAMQFARVVRGETDQMPKSVREKLTAFLDQVRELVRKWVGAKSLTTAELDSWILDKLGYAKRSEQSAAAAARPQGSKAPSETGATSAEAKPTPDISPAATQPAAAAKNSQSPWEMSRAEWEKERELIRPETFGESPAKAATGRELARINRLKELTFGVTDEASQKLRDAMAGKINLTPVEAESLKERVDTRVTHRDVVAKALSEGRSVPDEVLAEYPELRQVPSDGQPAAAANADARADGGRLVDRGDARQGFELPRDLTGAKPRYSYGSKQFTLRFDDELDKALYVLAQTTPSKRDADFLRAVVSQTGMDEKAARAAGAEVRARIKAIARDASAGELAVPASGIPSTPEPKPKETKRPKRDEKKTAPVAEEQPPLAPPQSFKETRSDLVRKIDDAIGKAPARDSFRDQAEKSVLRVFKYASAYNTSKTVKRTEDERFDALVDDAIRDLAGQVTVQSGNSKFTVTNTKEVLGRLRTLVSRTIGKPTDPSADPYATGVSQEKIIESYKKAKTDGERRSAMDQMTEASLKKLGLDKEFVRVTPGVVMPREGAEALAKLKAGETPEFDVLGTPAAEGATTFQYTIQRPQVLPDGRTMPGWVQVDEIVNGVNVRSSNLADLRAEGLELPDAPESLGTGQYTLDEVRLAASGTMLGAPAQTEDASARPEKPQPVPGQPGRFFRSLPDTEREAGAQVVRQVYERRSQQPDLDAASEIIRGLGEEAAMRISMNKADDGVPLPVKSAIYVKLIEAADQRFVDAKTPEERAKALRARQALSTEKAPAATEQGQQIAMYAQINKSARSAALNEYLEDIEDKQNDRLGKRGKKAVEEAEDEIEKADDEAIDQATKRLDRALRNVAVPTPIWEQYRADAAQRMAAWVDSRATLPEDRAPLADFTQRVIDEMQRRLDPLMPERPEAAPKPSAIDVLTEAISNKEKYADILTSVRVEFAEKYGEGSPMLDAIDTELANIGLQPYSKKLLTQAIDEAHAAMRTNLSELAKEHFTKTDAKSGDLADAIVRITGLSGVDATKLANALSTRAKELVAAARAKALDALKKRFDSTPKVKNILSAIERTVQFNNLGAFSRADMLDGIAKRIGLPTAKPEQMQEIAKLADAIETAANGATKARAQLDLANRLRVAKGFSKTDVATAVWYANMLSGYTTQLANVGGNMVNGTLNLATVMATNPKYAAEALRGWVDGFSEGWTQAKAIVTTGRGSREFDAKTGTAAPVLELVDYARDFPNLNETIANGLNKHAAVMRYVFRLMKGVDAAFYYPAREAFARVATAKLLEGEYQGKELYAKVREVLAISPAMFAQARTRAEQEGFTGLDLALRTANIVEEMRHKSDAGRAASEASERFALETTFNNDPVGWAGVLYRHLAQMTETIRPGGVPVLKVFLPFVRIPTNLFNTSMNYTPMGTVRAYRGMPTLSADGRKIERVEFTEEERSRLMLQSIGGSLTMAGLAAAALGLGDDDKEPWFTITATGPSDYRARQQLQATGWNQHSIKLGDAWVSYKDSPLLTPLALVGHVVDAVRYQKTKDDLTLGNMVVDAALKAPRVVFDTSMLSGLGQLFDLLQSRSSAAQVGQFLARVPATIAIPNLLAQIDRTFNPEARQADGPLGQVGAMLPFARNTGSARTDVLGDPVERAPLERFLSLEENDPVRDVLRDKNVFISVPRRDSKIGNQPMTPEQYDEFVRISGRAIRQRLSGAVPMLRQMNRAQVERLVDRITDQERQRAKPLVLRSVAVGR